MLPAFLAIFAAASMGTQAAPASPAPVQRAAPGKVSVADPPSLVAALQKAGYKAKLTQEEGKPEIESSAAGATFYLYFQNCESKEGCEDIMVQSAYNMDKDQVTVETINDFNRDNRWARAYLDKDRDACVEMDLDLVQGVTPEYLASQFAIWKEVLTNFPEHIDYY